MRLCVESAATWRPVSFAAKQKHYLEMGNMGTRNSWLKCMSLMVLAIATLTESSWGQAADATKEETIKLADLPKRVLEAVNLATDSNDIRKVELSTEDGRNVYEIEAKVEGGIVELVFNDKGRLIGIEIIGDEHGKQEESENAKSGESAKSKKADKEDEDGEDDDDGEDDEDDDGEHSSEVVKKLSIDDVPAAARKAIEASSGAAKLVGVESITEAGQTVYEAAWMKGDAKIEVIVTAAGSVIAEETSLSMEQLPKELQASAKKFAGKAELKLERKTIVLYEFEKVSHGKAVELYVDATGREITVSVGRDADDDENDDEDDDDDDQDDKETKHHLEDGKSNKGK